MTVIVTNMVCPQCARMNGQDHREGCPVARGSMFDDYGAGWQAARDALIPPLADEIVTLRDRQLDAFIALPMSPECDEARQILGRDRA